MTSNVFGGTLNPAQSNPVWQSEANCYWCATVNQSYL